MSGEGVGMAAFPRTKVNLGSPHDWRAVEVLDRKTFNVTILPLIRVPACPDILVAFTADGQPRAVSATCPHRSVRLDQFAKSGEAPGTLVCTAHGCIFDVATGECLNPAAVSDDVPHLGSWPISREPDGGYSVNLSGDEAI
jgi:nitrite reductase/ring-hydroxylating ferredoxin subunit